MNINDRRLIDENDIVLLVGSFNNQAILNEVYMARRNAKTRRLTSSPNNWREIIDDILTANDNGRPVFVNFSEAILLIACNPVYKEIYIELLNCLAESKHIIFLYQDAYLGKFNIFNKPFYTKYLFYEWSNSEDPRFGDERIFSHAELVRQTYVETVNQYCDEVLSGCSSVLGDEQKNKILDDIKCNFLSSVDRREFFDIEHLRSTDSFQKAQRLSQRFVMLSLAISEEEIDYRKKRLYSTYSYPEIRDRGLPFEGDGFSPFANEENEDILREVFNKKGLDKPSGKLFFEYWLRKNLIEKNTDVSKAISDLNWAISQITERQLNVVPYLHSIEFVSAIRDFFAEAEKRTIYTRYIYKDQLFAFEFERFLSLFQDYISKVKNCNIVFEELKTDIGTVYAIKTADTAISKDNFNEYIQEFADFLENCDFDTSLAMSLIKNTQLTEQQKSNLVHRFQKEARRLKLDIKHEAERGMLQLRQKYENLSIEGYDNSLFNDNIAIQLGDKPITSIVQIDKYFAGNVSSQTIYGDVLYNDMDTQLFELINQYAQSNQELIDALKILKDDATPNEQKNESSTKLKKFLATTASKIGDVGFKLLTKYLESLLFGS